MSHHPLQLWHVETKTPIQKSAVFLAGEKRKGKKKKKHSPRKQKPPCKKEQTTDNPKFCINTA